MATGNRQTGQKGEALAAGWLQERGYTILHRNWRWKNYEIDLVAGRNDVLHFIEVKTRTSTLFGHPEESVGAKKFRHIQTAAGKYLEQYPGWKRIQFDILSITLVQNEPPSFFLAADVFL
jgi:putative endonuclease